MLCFLSQLYQLSQGKVLERKQVAATVKLPPEELKELLSQVARLRRLKGWELVLPPDSHFIDQLVLDHSL